MNIYEPGTLLTDGLLAGLAGWFAWRLRGPTPAVIPAVRWWSWALGLTAASALVGGAYHGFAPNFPVVVGDTWWTATLLIICLVSAAMAMSLLHELVPVDRQLPWRGLILVKFIAFAAIAVVHPVFVVAVLDYGLTMLAWAAAALVLHRPWRGWMLAGIALSVIAALVQQMRWAPSERFNHNDLYHVIQALALFGFYRAGLGFSGRAKA